MHLQAASVPRCPSKSTTENRQNQTEYLQKPMKPQPIEYFYILLASFKGFFFFKVTPIASVVIP